MECGKLTAKLRDAVPVCFMVNDHEVKRYKNIEIPEEIKAAVDYVVPKPFGAGATGRSSQIIKLGLGGEVEILRP